MLPWIHSIRRVHHRSSHKYLRVVTVRGEGNCETVITTPDRLDRFSCLKQLHVQVLSLLYLIGLIILSSVVQLFSGLTID
jgi:hypothetical protein